MEENKQLGTRVENSEENREFLYCPKGHKVMLRAWTRYGNEKRLCSYCNILYDENKLLREDPFLASSDSFD